MVLLKQDVILRAIPGHIISQYELLPEDLAGDISPKGYIDIAVVFCIEREEVYMAYECKRLNVYGSGGGRKSLATEYVKEGMLRFVRAQYAQGLPFGVMLGYAMDGDATFAFDSVKERILEHAALLRCEHDLPKDIQPRGTFRSFTTVHQRPVCDIELRHVILPL